LTGRRYIITVAQTLICAKAYFCKDSKIRAGFQHNDANYIEIRLFGERQPPPIIDENP